MSLRAATTRLAASRIGHGVGANVFAQLTIAFIQLASVPLFASHWGVTTYGVWLLLFTIPAYLTLTDFGVATAAGNSMTLCVARGDRPGARATYHAARRFLLTIGGVLVCAAAAAIALTPDQAFPGAVINAAAGWREVAFVLVLYGAVCLQSGVSLAAFRAEALYARGVALQATIGICENLFAFGILLAGDGMLEVSLCYLTIRSLGALGLLLMVRRQSRWLFDGPTSGVSTALGDLWRPALAVMALPTAQAVFLQGSVFAVGAVVGIQAVPVFTAARTLSRLGIQMTTVVNHALMPEFTIARGKGDVDRQRLLLQINALAMAAILTPLFLVILVLGPWIVGLWTQNTIHAPLPLMMLMSIVMLLNGLWWPMANLILSINRQATYSYLYLVLSGLSIALSFPLMRIMGISGIGAALALLDAVMLVYVAVLVDRIGIFKWADLGGAIRQFSLASILGLFARRRLQTEESPEHATK